MRLAFIVVAFIVSVVSLVLSVRQTRATKRFQDMDRRLKTFEQGPKVPTSSEPAPAAPPMDGVPTMNLLENP